TGPQMLKNVTPEYRIRRCAEQVPGAGTNSHKTFCNNRFEPRSAPARSRQFSEVLEQSQAVLLTLFRMELRGEQIVAPDAGTEWLRIVGLGRNDRLVARHHVVRVHEIEVGPLVDAGEDRRSATEADL